MTGWREKCDEVTSAGCGAVGYIAALEAAAVAYSPWPSLTDVLAGAGLSHLADGRKAAILAANNAGRLARFVKRVIEEYGHEENCAARESECARCGSGVIVKRSGDYHCGTCDRDGRVPSATGLRSCACDCDASAEIDLLWQESAK